MNSFSNLEHLTANMAATSQMDIIMILLSFSIGILYSIVISLFYNRFESSISDKNSFTLTSTLLMISIIGIIMVIKSSLALSLGLVGALSIVRMRTAVKDPQLLMYYLIIIAIALSLGAGNFVIASFVFILSLIYMISKFKLKKRSVVVAGGKNKVLIADSSMKNFFNFIMTNVEKNGIEAYVKRVDQHNNSEKIYLEISNFNSKKFDSLTKELKKNKINYTYIG
jgi:hypothetical protein